MPKTFILKPNVLKGIILEPNKASLVIEPRTEGERKFKMLLPKQVSPGISLLTVNIKFDSWDLHEWSEALIEILP